MQINREWLAGSSHFYFGEDSLAGKVNLFLEHRMTPAQLCAWVEQECIAPAHDMVLRMLPAERRAAYEQATREASPLAGSTSPAYLEIQPREMKPGDFAGPPPESPSGDEHSLMQIAWSLRPSGARGQGKADAGAPSGQLRRQFSNAGIARQIVDGTDDEINEVMAHVDETHRPHFAAALDKMSSMMAPINRRDIDLSTSSSVRRKTNLNIQQHRESYRMRDDFPSPSQDRRQEIFQKAVAIHAYYESTRPQVGLCGEMSKILLQELQLRGVPAHQLFHAKVWERGEPAGTTSGTWRNHVYVIYSPKGLSPNESDDAWPLVTVDPWAPRGSKLTLVESPGALRKLARQQLDHLTGGTPGSRLRIEIV